MAGCCCLSLADTSSIHRLPMYAKPAPVRVAITSRKHCASSKVAPASCSPSATAWTKSCWIGSMPLVGFEFVPQPFSKLVMLHSFVVIGTSNPSEECMLLDFLPDDPTSPSSAAKLLSGQASQGTTRLHKLPRFIHGPKIETRLAGSLKEELADDDVALAKAIEEFNRSWDTQLHLVNNNCHHYSQSLIKHLTATA